MKSVTLAGPALLAFLLAPACGPATAPAATPSSPPAPSVGASAYPVCAPLPGADPAQLAPAFVDQMAACSSAAPPATTPPGSDGKVSPAGNCDFPTGVSCHFHTSMEFVKASRLKEPGVGEMHCIVPSADKNRPTVLGAHVRCKAGTSASKGAVDCPADLLRVVDRGNCTTGWKCCDQGTLTKPVSKQSDAEKQLRPDFRICGDDAVEIDCGLLHGMQGHTANVAGLGQEYQGDFGGSGHEDRP